MKKQKVLFICVHNSARSQMAEAYLNKLGGKKFKAESAGLQPGTLNPFAVKAMKKDGIDISRNKTQSVMDIFNQGKHYAYVISVCSKADSEQCPVFPGKSIKLHWPFDDPSCFKGTPAEKLKATIKIRNQIKAKISKFISRASSK